MKPQPSWLLWALGFPSFFLSFLLLYWAVVLAVLTGHINPLRRRGRNDLFCTAKLMMDAMHVSVMQAGQQQLCRAQCMYLANHRSWADFFIDAYLTEGRAMPLSRGMVAVAFPALMLPLRAVGAVLVFNKAKGVKDVEAFNRWLDRELQRGGHSSLLVYPEGHRKAEAALQPIKHGMLCFAYSRRLPIQVVMSANKEEVLSEKDDMARWGQTVVASCSEPLDPAKFPSSQEFAGAVQEAWETEWARVTTTPLAGLPSWVASPALLDYSPSQQLTSLALHCLCAAALSSALYCTFVAATWVAHALAAVQAALPLLAAGSLLAWAGMSAWLAASPVGARGGLPVGGAGGPEVAAGAACKAQAPAAGAIGGSLVGRGVLDSAAEEPQAVHIGLKAGKEE
ncbi:hypothetical protein N2152v2_008659 [Parachlorella kessleri]